MKNGINYLLLLMQVVAVVGNLLLLLFPQLRSCTVIYLIIILGYGCGVALSIRFLIQREKQQK
ncbi:hypothetical protein [Flavonifractor plautii]|uniref:hypothetical protein n=1 Tax=Flavonifractor plautii TaxID=292800 RepID=UPI001958A021|nr:hypothetical protein [Flavonifractor plautii]MBM6664755.1 hypothetical protein [Flavonifractor plautii]